MAGLCKGMHTLWLALLDDKSWQNPINHCGKPYGQWSVKQILIFDNIDDW